jgi:hypothetical protein
VWKAWSAAVDQSRALASLRFLDQRLTDKSGLGCRARAGIVDRNAAGGGAGGNVRAVSITSRNFAGGEYSPPDHATRSSMLRRQRGSVSPVDERQRSSGNARPLFDGARRFPKASPLIQSGLPSHGNDRAAAFPESLRLVRWRTPSSATIWLTSSP